MSCPRCAGLLAVQWDEETRAEYVYCLLCGNRPALQSYRADGQPLGSATLCIDCQVMPVMMVELKCMKILKEAVRCLECRDKHNAKRRNMKRAQQLAYKERTA